jgi:hypothetical protein
LKKVNEYDDLRLQNRKVEKQINKLKVEVRGLLEEKRLERLASKSI